MSVAQGTVAHFDIEKNFGFIRPDDNSPDDVFITAKELARSAISFLIRGQRVEYDVVPGPRGPRATNLHILQ